MRLVRDLRLDALRHATPLTGPPPDAGFLASGAMPSVKRSLTPALLLAGSRKVQAELPHSSGVLSEEMPWAMHQAGDSAQAHALSSKGGHRMRAASLAAVLRLDVFTGRSRSSVANEPAELYQNSSLRLMGTQSVAREP